MDNKIDLVIFSLKKKENLVVVLVSSSLKIKFMNEITHDELSFSYHIISPLHREDNLMFLSLYLSAQGKRREHWIMTEITRLLSCCLI